MALPIYKDPNTGKVVTYNPPSGVGAGAGGIQNATGANGGTTTAPVPLPVTGTPGKTDWTVAVDTDRSWQNGGGYMDTQAPAPAPSTAPQPTSGGYGQDGILNQPGHGEQWWQDNKGWFNQPTSAGDWWNNYAKDWFSQGPYKPETTKDAYDKYMEEMGEPQWGEQNAYHQAGKMGSINYGDDAIKAARDGLEQNTRLSDAYDGLQEFFAGNPVKDEYEQYFAGDVRGPSFLEELYRSGEGLSGLDKLYEREQRLKQRALDDSFAARGLFGGEAALRGSIELGDAMAASKIRDILKLAGDADTMRLNRIGMGRDWINDIDDTEQSRSGMKIDAAGAADESGRAGLKMLMDALGFASDEAITTTEKSAALGLGADESKRARNNDVFNRALDLDGLMLDAQDSGVGMMSAGAGIAQGADMSDLARKSAGGNFAFTAQNAEEGRELGALNAIMGMTGQVSGAFTGQVNQALDGWMKGEFEKIEAELAAGKISADDAERKRREIQDSVNGLLKLFAGG